MDIFGYFLCGGLLLVGWVAEWVITNPLVGIPTVLVAIAVVSVLCALVEG